MVLFDQGGKHVSLDLGRNCLGFMSPVGITDSVNLLSSLAICAVKIVFLELLQFPQSVGWELQFFARYS